jgi:hypothetical protein
MCHYPDNRYSSTEQYKFVVKYRFSGILNHAFFDIQWQVIEDFDPSAICAFLKE